MSIAGIRSNRGDNYQTYVAFDWALTVLTDPEFHCLEVDSSTYSVDDIVIGRIDGSLICCQCKKNQADFRAWSIADLADELDKAVQTLSNHQHVQIRFYSRSEFGKLAKLREYSVAYSNKAEYHANLTQEHIKTDTELSNIITVQAPNLSTYEFLCNIVFSTTEDFDRMESLLRERLRQITSNSSAAFDALWTRLDKLGGRMDSDNLSTFTKHRFTKDDLKNILHRAGAMLIPPIDVAQVRTSFASTSAIGRSWQRNIAGHCIPILVVNELLDAIDAEKRSILLTGGAGSGKTCMMLSLQEALEQRMQSQTDLVALFIQSREFADMETAQERQAQGLSEKWVEQAARLAEDTHVVVIIDSLDVLSIAREHSILKYFLAQVDRLLMIPKITVVTACRDFDRKYDRQIASRNWDCELQCPQLDWESEIKPLLTKLEINSITIDTITRELIRTPRELALFVELAQREGSFNVVTGQALAQRYLDTIVKADPTLGDTAMLAIEAMASEMLKLRSLSIPHQRFFASQEILKKLCSLNVVQDTHDGKLTFGHQTLLDVLVISSAIRKGVSLNDFIQNLPPVPFVRPSIRSFVAQLSTGERREFRKQIRAVLTGKAAFHIRRLIAELFAQQRPHNDDWPMIKDLRGKHREVFEVIYTQASLVEWHCFWLTYLVPTLKGMQDAEGVMIHIHRVEQWKNEDAAGVLAFWMETLEMDWLDTDKIANRLACFVSDFKTENLRLVTPLLERLIGMSIPEHNSLGYAIADCVTAGVVDDGLLWHYVAGDIGENEVISFNFEEKIRCADHKFGSKRENFLRERMVQSTALLDLAVETIEQWSRIKSSHYSYHEWFLSDTSYKDKHSQDEFRFVDCLRILFDAIEAAILYHAKVNSDWWLRSRESLCLSHESALYYFVVLAFTSFPQPNIDLIGRLLCGKNLLRSQFRHELGELINAAFIHLDSHTQDIVTAEIETIRKEDARDEEERSYLLRSQVEYISAIPCHLRSIEFQSTLASFEAIHGKFIREPSIYSSSGRVDAPFSFEKFLSISDAGIICLLEHYSGYDRDLSNSLIGGGQEVGQQLREAASRHPSRFLGLLVVHWVSIVASFRDNIMEGIAEHLECRYRNNSVLTPVEEPDASTLSNQILEELERHSVYWYLNRSAAEALRACSHVIRDEYNASRLVFLTIGFGNLKEESTIRSNSNEILTNGINMTSGKIAMALMNLVNNLQENGVASPELLAPTLRRFASNESPAIRALIVQRLPYLQSRNPELGWDLFYLAMKDATKLWQFAEGCLYYAYRDHFKRVAPLLDRIYHTGSEKDMEIWGRISALSALAGHINLADFLDKLKRLNTTEAWHGASLVWTNTVNIRQHRDQCLIGIEAGLTAGRSHAISVAKNTVNIFRENTQPIFLPVNLLQLCFDVYESNNGDNSHHLFEFGKWLNAISQQDPETALTKTEVYLAYVSRTNQYYHDYQDQLAKLLTQLFAEAEEREESDHGLMLNRVVLVQDLLLSLGIDSVNDWLKSAERQ